MKHRLQFSKYLILLTCFILIIFNTKVFAYSFNKGNLTNTNNIFLASSQKNTSKTKHILILNSYEKGIKWSDNLISSATQSLQNYGLDIDVDIEYMDTKRFSSDYYLYSLYDLYKYKYRDKKFDLIISIDDSAFNFLLDHNKQLFNDTPIVFCGVNYFKDSMLENKPMFTGIVENVAIKETLDMALSIHNNTKNVILLNDNSTTGIAIEKYIKELIPKYNNKMNFIFVDSLDFLNNKDILKKYSQDSILLLLSGFVRNYNEKIFIKEDVPLSVDNLDIPFYSVWEFFLNHGVVGGKMVSADSQGNAVAKMAIRVLNGENPKNIPVLKDSQAKYMFDYNLLKKFHIHSSLLPKESTVINLPPKSYEIPKSLIWMFVILCISLLSFLVVNILERRKATIALIESEERLRTLINASPDLICLKNENGKWLEINKAGINFFNLDGIEWKGKTSEELAEIDDTNKNRLLNYRNSDKLAWEKGSIIKYQQEFQTLNNDNIVYTIIKVPLFHSNGTRRSLVVIGHDITSHIKAENGRKLLNEMVEYEKLRTDFFANISHELRTPLNVILSALQYIELMLNDGSIYNNKYDLKKYSTIMKQNSYRLVRILNNLIDITKIDSGYFELNLENYNIVEVVEEICLSVAPYIESKNLKFIFDTEIEEKIIACDADLIERIVLNLLSNAIKFTNSNGQVTVNIYDKIDNVQISVKDTGIGIPKDKLSLIFERFVQVDKSLSRNREGSGIGLSLVKALAKMHGGKIDLKSEVGKGSEFIVSLPVKTIPNKEIKIYSNLATQESSTEKINIEFSDIYS